ncbi:MAG: hypothetical protein EKK42_20315 [Pseudonocardiaceae bacterium]|nr:MAG: hypothetical protein EKK42_20315 [Pseudonocardiaceae bacterium]
MGTETRVSGNTGWSFPDTIDVHGVAREEVLIGLTGRAGSGKNTVADIICELLNADAPADAPVAEQYALAGPVKTMALAIDPIVDYEAFSSWRLSVYVNMHGWDAAKRVPEVRRFLQRLGTEGVRGTFGDDAWVDLMRQWWDEDTTARVGVLTDVRFPNELAAVDISIRVERNSAELTGDNAAHASEQLDAQVDYVIHNNGTRDDLRCKVWGVLADLKMVDQSSGCPVAAHNVAA